jgi:NitT/TauT family transport system substrate-binding protein
MTMFATPSSRGSVSRRSFVGGLGVLASLALTPTRPALAQSRGKMRIGFIPGDSGAQAYFARELGLFEKAGYELELSPISNGAAITAAVLSGALDFGQTNVVALAGAHERGLPVSLVCATNYYNPKEATTGIVSVLQDSPVRNAKDLEGKTVAVSGLREVAGLAVMNWMDTNGADSSKAKFVEIPFPTMAEALRQKRVDAAALNLAFVPTLGQPGDAFRVVANAYDSVAARWVISSWCAANDWAAKHPDDVKRYVEVMKAASTWANTHKDEAAAVLAKALNQDVARIKATPRPTYETVLTPALVQPGINLSAKYGVIKAGFPAQELLSPQIPK